jgi:hypothetical protein
MVQKIDVKLAFTQNALLMLQETAEARIIKRMQAANWIALSVRNCQSVCVKDFEDALKIQSFA